jgi:NAD(P)-dependent dehydrogenase (short-subunit alcohol dehydrogenase family)
MKNIIITGANSGIGFETAKHFAQNGDHVILAVRNLQKGANARDTILNEIENAHLDVQELNLSSLKSIKDFSEKILSAYTSLELLVNNAGVMTPPFEKTEDGFELQFGSNHLGHFALTGLLLPLFKQTDSARIVTLSSIAHRRGSIYFDNLHGDKGYNAMMFYAQSKYANLLFAKELDLRLKEHGIPVKSIAAHPGVSQTNLFQYGALTTPVLKPLLNLFVQPAEKGALSSIYAATSDKLLGGEYIGPDGFFNMKGKPTIEIPKSWVYNPETIKKLWKVSEELTGVNFEF